MTDICTLSHEYFVWLAYANFKSEIIVCSVDTLISRKFSSKFAPPVLTLGSIIQSYCLCVLLLKCPYHYNNTALPWVAKQFKEIKRVSLSVSGGIELNFVCTNCYMEILNFLHWNSTQLTINQRILIAAISTQNIILSRKLFCGGLNINFFITMALALHPILSAV